MVKRERRKKMGFEFRWCWNWIWLPKWGWLDPIQQNGRLGKTKSFSLSLSLYIYIYLWEMRGNRALCVVKQSSSQIFVVPFTTYRKFIGETTNLDFEHLRR